MARDFERGTRQGTGNPPRPRSASMSNDFQGEVAFLGMTDSPSFVRAPERHGVAERFIRTPKENLLWIRYFATVAELIEALREVRLRYNGEWLIERDGRRMPSQARDNFAAASKRLQGGPERREVE